LNDNAMGRKGFRLEKGAVLGVAFKRPPNGGVNGEPLFRRRALGKR
jgi:hypothetical protein